MSVLNRVILIGRLTRDPESKTTASGKQRTTFTVAVDRRSKNSEKSADFIPVVTWDYTADFCAKYLRKGRQVAVEGRLQIDSQQQPDGSYRTFVNVVADDVQALGSKSDVSGAAGGAQSYSRSTAPDPIADDMDEDLDGGCNMDVPF